MYILHHQQQRSSFAQGSAKGDHVLKEAQLLRLGIQRRVGRQVGIAQAQGRGEDQQVSQHKVRQAKAVLRPVGERPAQDLGKGRVGPNALSVALPLQHPPASDPDMGDELTHQPRFPDAGLTADQQRLPLAGACLLPQGPHLGQFALPSHQSPAFDPLQHRQLPRGDRFPVQDLGRL